jgi:4-hydroxyphenylpyruvate dioxygenase
MTLEMTLTDSEKLARLDAEELRRLVGLVEYDSARDPFPVSGWDAIVWVVGNATQTAHYFQSVYGMELVAYSGPITGNRDHHAYVLRSGAVRFVIKGAVDPDSALVEHHRRHGDGVVDIALQVPDVDKCIAHARSQGATILDEPRDITDEHGTVRTAAIATYGDTRHTLVDRSCYAGRICPDTSSARPPSASAMAHRSGCSRRSITWSATSRWAAWTSGWVSTTVSWRSPTWPSSSATTSPPTIRR